MALLDGSAAQSLAAIIEPAALALLGEPNKRLSTKDELRFGSNGSLSVQRAGANRGTWFDHEAGAGGGVLDLVVRERGGDHRAAFDWLASEFPDRVQPDANGRAQTIIATYPYVDPNGALLFEVLRFAPKGFQQRRPDGKGGWIWNLKGVDRPLYRLPEVLEGVATGARIYIVEGEKDADRLRAAGLVATTSGAAKSWTDKHSQHLRGARVAILPDNDKAGEGYAEQVCRALTGVAASIVLTRLDGLRPSGDVSDWLDGDGTVDELASIVQATPEWRPSTKHRFPIVQFGREDEGPPLTWLVRGLLPEAGLSVVFGPPKSSKTFLALDLALHVAHGRDWYGLRTQVGGVVYISGEGAGGIRQRMKAWRLEKGGDASAPFWMIPQSINLFDGEEELTRLIQDLRDYEEPMGGPVRMVVLDTLSRMIGSGDEDKARDINVVVRSAERIQRETGAHVMIVHHSGKDRDRGMRGSNALLGAVDAAIEVSKDDTGRCEAKVPAIKDGGEIGPFSYTLRKSTVGEDADGEPIVTCVIDPAGASQGDERSRSPRLTDAEKHAVSELRKLCRDSGTSRDNIVFVPRETWRDRIITSTVGAYETRKRQANRVINSLNQKHIVAVKGEEAWLPEGPP